jgi:hypothetical protein
MNMRIRASSVVRWAAVVACLVATVSFAHSRSSSAAGPEGRLVSTPSKDGLPAWARDLPPDDLVTDARRDAIQEEAHAFAKRATFAERGEFLTWLTHGARCGRAHGAALAGAFSAGVEPILVSEALETMSTACDEVIVESAGLVPNPDATLAAVMLQLTTSDDENVRRAASQSYSSIYRTLTSAGVDADALAQK